MNQVKISVGISIAGLTLIMPLSGVATDDQQIKPVWVQEKNRETETAVRVVQAQDKKPAPAADMPVYTPPKRGAPAGRIGGGTRGTCGPGEELPVLHVLAPDHTGLTVQERPSLYWYISKSTTYPVELTIIDDKNVQPLIETRLGSPVQSGVHRIRLGDHGVRLSPGVAYRWFVAVVCDSARRSQDIIAGGAIERVELPEALGGKLAKADKLKDPHIYAEAGLWYDAMTAISELIDAAPNDTVLRKQRASLLEQVGLRGISE